MENEQQPNGDEQQPVEQPSNEEPMVETAPAEQPTDEQSAEVTVGNVAAVDAPADAEHWRLESWNGLPKLQCSYCNFSTMRGEKEMAEHVKRHFTPPRAAGTSGLVSPSGGAL